MNADGWNQRGLTSRIMADLQRYQRECIDLATRSNDQNEDGEAEALRAVSRALGAAFDVVKIQDIYSLSHLP